MQGSFEQLVSLYERAATALRRSGLPVPEACDVASPLGRKRSTEETDEGFDTDNSSKRALVNDINALRSSDRETRYGAASRLRDAFRFDSPDTLRDAASLGALCALATAFAAAARRGEPDVQLAAATAIAALIPAEHEPTALLQHAPALLSALRLVLQRRRETGDERGLWSTTCADTRAVAVAVAHFTVLLQQGWVGDERDLAAAAEDFAENADRLHLLEDASGYLSPVPSGPRHGNTHRVARRPRSWGHSRRVATVASQGSDEPVVAGETRNRRRRMSASATVAKLSRWPSTGDDEDESILNHDVSRISTSSRADARSISHDEDGTEEAADDDGDPLTARRSALARRTIDALVAVACHTAVACSIVATAKPMSQDKYHTTDSERQHYAGDVDAGTRALVAFAISNLAQLPAARPCLVRRGALNVLATWLRSRPCSELHRHAASTIASICGASEKLTSAGWDEDPPHSGAMAALSSVLPAPDVHTRGWIDARVTIKPGGALEAMVPLTAAPISAVRAHVVAALAALVARPPNRAAVVANGGVRALVDVLARTVRDLRLPPRAAAAASLAETAIVALTMLALEVFFCSERDATKLTRRAEESAALSCTNTSDAAEAPMAVRSVNEMEVSAPESTTALVSDDGFKGFLEEAEHKRRRVARLSVGGNEEEKDEESNLLTGEIGNDEKLPATRPEASTSSSTDGVRVGAIVVDNGAIPLLTAVVCLADPSSSLRAVAVRALALLTDDERGCGADRWHLFFERTEIIRPSRLDDGGGGDDDDTETTDNDRAAAAYAARKPRLRAPAAIDALIRLCVSIFLEDAQSTPLNDADPIDIFDVSAGSASGQGHQVHKQSSDCSNAAHLAELTHVAFIIANVASRGELASLLTWRHGATPVLVRLARSPYGPLRTYALRALASLATPLITAPSRSPSLDEDAIEIEDAAAAAAAIVDVALEAMDVAIVARGVRDPDVRRRRFSGPIEKAAYDLANGAPLLDGEDAAEQLLYEVVRTIKALALAEPLRAPLVRVALRCILCIAIDARGASPQLRALAEASLVTLGFEGGASDLQLCGNDDKLLEEWFAMRRALELQDSLHAEYARALADAWPPPPIRVTATRDSWGGCMIVREDAVYDEDEDGDHSEKDSQSDQFDEEGDVSDTVEQVQPQPLTSRGRGGSLTTAPRSVTPTMQTRPERTTSEPAGSHSAIATPTGTQDYHPHFWSDVRGTVRKVFSANPLARPGGIFRCASADVNTDDDWYSRVQGQASASTKATRLTQSRSAYQSDGVLGAASFFCPVAALDAIVPEYDEFGVGNLRAARRVSPLGPYDATAAAHRVVEVFDRLGSRNTSLGEDDKARATGDKYDIQRGYKSSDGHSGYELTPEESGRSYQRSPLTLHTGNKVITDGGAARAPAIRKRDKVSPRNTILVSKKAIESDDPLLRQDSGTPLSARLTPKRAGIVGRSQLARPLRLALQRAKQSSSDGSSSMRDDEDLRDDDHRWQTIWVAAKKLPDWWAMNVERFLDEQDLERPSLNKKPITQAPRSVHSKRNSAFGQRGAHASARRSSLSWHFFGVSEEEVVAGRLAANDGEMPLRLKRYLRAHFPSYLQQRRVAPLHRVPGGSATWSPRATCVIALPSRQYFSFRREARVLARVIEAHNTRSKSRRWALLFKDARFAGEFTDSLATCLSKLPSVESVAFSRSKNPIVCSHVEVEAGECPGGRTISGAPTGGFFGGSAADAADDLNSPSLATSLAYLVGALPLTVQSITLDRMLGREALQILGILLRTAEERRARAVREQLALVDEHRQLSSNKDKVVTQQRAIPSTAAAISGPSLALLAVKNHDYLRPDDFGSLIAYLRTCVASPSTPFPFDSASSLMRSLRWLDLSGNRLGDAGVGSVVSAIDRKDSSITALDLSSNNLGAFAAKTLDALFRESAETVHGDADHNLSEQFSAPAPPKTSSKVAPKAYVGALFCGAKLRYLSLAGNGLGPRAAARLLNAMVDHGAPNRSSLRGLSLENSGLGPPCAIGALASLSAALRALAKSPGLLEELDLRNCRLQADCAKELLFGLVEARAAADGALPELRPRLANRPTAPEDDEFLPHESESDTEQGKMYPPMPSLAQRSRPPASSLDRLTENVTPSPSSRRSSSKTDLSALAAQEPDSSVGREQRRQHNLSAVKGTASVRFVEACVDAGNDAEERIRQRQRYRRRRKDPLAFLHEEEEDADEGAVSNIHINERGILGTRNEDEVNDLDGDPESASRRDFSRLSFIRLGEGNTVDQEDVKLVRDELRRNRERRVKRAAARRQFLRRSSSERSSPLDRSVASPIPPLVQATPAIATAVPEGTNIPSQRQILFAEATVAISPEPTPEEQPQELVGRPRRAVSLPVGGIDGVGESAQSSTQLGQTAQRSRSDGEIVADTISVAPGVTQAATSPLDSSITVLASSRESRVNANASSGEPRRRTPAVNNKDSYTNRRGRNERPPRDVSPLSSSTDGDSTEDENVAGASLERRTLSWPMSGVVDLSAEQRRQRRRQIEDSTRTARSPPDTRKNDVAPQRHHHRPRQSEETYSVCALFASPLAWQDATGDLHPIQPLDFDSEREAIASSFDAARKNRHGVRVRFDVATTERLRTYVTLGKCSIIHYAGHGHPQALTFEDGRGGLQPVTPNGISTLINAGATAAKNDGSHTDAISESRIPRLAFVCACHSKRAALAFVEAGIPHVIAVALETALLDSAALAFTQAFYLALSVGDTVANAFAVGVEAVASSPHVNAATEAPRAQQHPTSAAFSEAQRPRASSVGDSGSKAGRLASRIASKFELLPIGGNHEVPIFPRLADERRKQSGRIRPLPPPSWPPEYEDDDDVVEHSNLSTSIDAAERRRMFRRRYGPGLHSPPQPPDDFLGREVEVYRVVDALARRRKLISIVGATGVGKSALVSAVARYAAERRFFADGIIYLRLHGASTVCEVEAGLRDVFKAARDKTRRIRRAITSDSGDESEGSSSEITDASPSDDGVASTSPFEVLRYAQILLILDGVELIDNSELRMMLNQLFDEARNVSVLLSSRALLCRRSAPRLAPGSGAMETVVRIGPLALKSAARLFARQCPQLHTAADRRKFHDLMAEHPKDTSAQKLREAVARVRAGRAVNFSSIVSVRSAANVLSSRERRVLAALGNGFPADIVARAFDTTRSGLEQLLDVAAPTPEDEAADQAAAEAAAAGMGVGDDEAVADESAADQ